MGFKSNIVGWHSCVDEPPKESGSYLLMCVSVRCNGKCTIQSVTTMHYSVKFAEKFGNPLFGWNRYDSWLDDETKIQEPSYYCLMNAKGIEYIWTEYPKIQKD